MNKYVRAMKAVVFAGVLLAPVAAQADVAAKLQIYPTRIEIKDGENSSFVNVINGGSATGSYRVSLDDVVMPERGALQVLPDGQKSPYSAKDYVRLSPRSITVPPGQSQKFRLISRIPRDAPDGEYMSHINVLMSSTDVSKPVSSGEGIALTVQPRFRVSIPLVIYKGVTSFNATIASLSLEDRGDATRKPSLLVEFTNEGNRSARADLTVMLEKGGKSYKVFFASDVAIYRGLARRFQTVQLDLPEGVTLDGGVLKVMYIGKKDQVLAQKTLNL